MVTVRGQCAQRWKREWPINPQKKRAPALLPAASRAGAESRSICTGRVHSATPARRVAARPSPERYAHAPPRCASIPGCRISGSVRETYRSAASAAHEISCGRHGSATGRHQRRSTRSLQPTGAAIVEHRALCRGGRSSRVWALLRYCAQNKLMSPSRQAKQRTVFIGTIGLVGPEVHDG